MVHRLLKAAIDREHHEKKQESITDRLPEIAVHTSSRERIAEEAEREIERIKKAQFMADKIGQEFAGTIISVNSRGLFVELTDHYVEGFVPFTALIDDRYRFSEKTHSIIGSRRQTRFRPGSRISVLLDNVDMENARLLFSVVSGR